MAHTPGTAGAEHCEIGLEVAAAVALAASLAAQRRDSALKFSYALKQLHAAGEQQPNLC
jgi:hypothetical protein